MLNSCRHVYISVVHCHCLYGSYVCIIVVILCQVKQVLAIPLTITTTTAVTTATTTTTTSITTTTTCEGVRSPTVLLGDAEDPGDPGGAGRRGQSTSRHPALHVGACSAASRSDTSERQHFVSAELYSVSFVGLPDSCHNLALTSIFAIIINNNKLTCLTAKVLSLCCSV